MRIILAGLLLVATLNSAQAESTRYGQWGGAAADTQTVFDELRKLIDEAEKSRAADPRFLDDLRALIRRHDYPWRLSVVREDFADRDYAQNPAWTVVDGYFEVDWRGLSSRVSEYQPRQPAQGGESGRDQVKNLLTNMLVGAMQGRRQQQPSQGRYGSNPAMIALDVGIPNAFAVEAVVSGETQAGGVELGVYQQRDRSAGYRLSFTPGEGLMLLRVSFRGGVALVERSQGDVNLADGLEHTVAWQRHADGKMVVGVDGVELFSVVDNGFRDNFDGFSLINRGGEFSLRRLNIDGGA